MNVFSKALLQDKESNYLAAVRDYQAAIIEEAPLDAFINSSFIYWEASTQQGFTGKIVIPESLSTVGWDKCFLLIANGLLKYSNDLELNFWNRYFKHRGIFDDFTEYDCICLLNNCVNHNDTLVPYFFLSLFDKGLYTDEVKRILTRCEEEPTAKNKWICSVLNSKIF